MKFTAVFSILACTVATVSAVGNSETNAARMARGLPPNPPVRRSRTYMARHPRPSSHPGGAHCSTGPVQCCNSVTHSGDLVAGLLATTLGTILPADATVGMSCSPLSAIGIGGNNCNAQTVCCENNSFNGAIAIGCSPININL